MLVVESLQRLRKRRLVELQRVELHQLAEILAHITHAEIAGDVGLVLQSLAHELVHCRTCEGLQLVVEGVQVHRVGTVIDRSRTVDAEVRQKRAERRAEPRMGRHDDLLHLERRRDIDGVQRAGTAEGDQRIVAVVDAALDRHQPDGVRHVLGRGLQDCACRLHGRQPELLRQAQHTASCALAASRVISPPRK